MRVIMCGGGTGGHIYPALAIINKIKELEPNSEFLYIGTHNRMEKDIVPENGIPFKSIKMYGFNRKNIFKNFKTVYYLLKNKKICKQIIKEFNPDVVIGVGGYVTVPVIKAAHKLGYKTIIHEQNSMPGKANKMLGKIVDKIFVSSEAAIKYFDAKKCVLTGNPVSENALIAKPIFPKDYGVMEGKKCVLFVMGSLGAKTVNDIIVSSFKEFKKKDYEVIFVTGKNDYESVIKNEIPKNVHVVPYINGLSGIFKNIDLMVTRAGASTISEIIALEVPAIMIPSPFVPDDHQTKNAMDLVNNKAGVLLKESELTVDTLTKTIDSVLNDQEKVKEFKKNLKSMNVLKSATKIYEEIKK